MSEHDPYCKSYYPALTDPKTCTWCYVIREVRRDEYFKAWDEGFGIGYGEGYEKAKETYTNDCFECGYAGEWSTWVCDDCQKNMSTNEDNDDMSLNEDIRAQRIQRGIDKWKEDIDVAYWQGYNNAMIEISEASAAGTSKPSTTTQKLDTLGFFNMGTTDYMCPFCVTPWKCNGPHIDEGDMENFLLYMEDRNAESND